MKLSIIVPVYNVEKYLKKCVESILCQTFSDYELILVDDGSTDNCPAICDEYARMDCRVRVIHKKNGGLSDARNAGLGIARGIYVGFVDSDDFIHPQMYEALMFLGEKSMADMVQCEFCKFFADEEAVIKEIEVEEISAQLFTGEEIIGDFNDKKQIIHSTVCNKIYQRAIFQNIKFPKGYFYEDSYIHLSTLEKARIIAKTSVALYFYRQRSGSIMHSEYSPKWFQGTYNNNNNNLAYFRKKKLKKQEQYALDELATRFTKDRMAVYIRHPYLKKDFQELNGLFVKELPMIITNPEICKMKKVMLVLQFVSPLLAYRICKNIFPECLYDFMR